MSRFALVTSRKFPGLTDDDRLLAGALERRGHEASPAVWDDAGVHWAGFDGAVIRSTWDYHLQPQAFGRWIDLVEAAGVRLINPPRLARWNMEKTYLRDLEARGVLTVPTRWLEPGEFTTLADLRRETGWSDIVLKPAVSATAWQLCRAAPHDPELPAAAAEALATTRFMAQPFMAGIEQGEWSLVFFAADFSHAVIKRPQAGEFRVQQEYGGQAEPAVPPPHLVSAARRILERAPEPAVYARVDGLESPEGFVLLELELLEPALFLGTSEDAADRFAGAVLAALRRP